MTKKAVKALARLAKAYSKQWDASEYQLRLLLLGSGPCWVAQVGDHKGINRKCPLKAIKDLRKQLDRKAVAGFKGTPCAYPSVR